MGAEFETSKRIVIFGGGSAGWITANALVHRWNATNVDIRLVESPDIGTVGVGEGSTPRLKIFFDDIGVAEAEWMPKCNATYKNGISFLNWSTKPGFDRYFHPFPSVIDQHTSTAFYFNTFARRQGVNVHAHPDRFFLAAQLAHKRQGPKPNENFPFFVEYGYHFDARLLGEFLKKRATARGVRHTQARVVDMNRAQNGDIASLVTDGGETIEGDFFIDCSGFRGVLLQQTLHVPFRSFGENLFNDAAVVLPTRQEERIASETLSTAMKHGWAWQIPLTNRIGNGYVYSSKHCSADDAETELRSALGVLDAETEARHLKMNVGRVDVPWHRNCLAVGLSQGFIEPLEATALNLVCNTIYLFMETVEAHNFNGDGRQNFNQTINSSFENVRDYIVAHYILNSRDDSDYWRQNAENKNVSDTLRRILTIWKSGQSLSQEMERQQITSSYTPMSWNCLLAGYGFYPDIRSVRADHPALTKVDMNQIDDFIRRCSMNFGSQNEQLQFGAG